MDEPVLEVDGVSFAYEKAKPALDDVSFQVPAGCFTALLGPNGAGKTTLMALITRLFQSRCGTIRIAGCDLATASRAAHAAMGVVFQRPTLDLDLSVRLNLRYAASLHGLAGSKAKAQIEALTERLGLASRRTHKVRALSGGLRRRVELARALLHEPQLLILDEPTVGLDIESRQAIVEHVHQLCRERGLAVLWTTHLIDEVWPGDRLIVLDQGVVLAEGPLDSVLRRTGAPSLADAYARLTPPKAA